MLSVWTSFTLLITLLITLLTTLLLDFYHYDWSIPTLLPPILLPPTPLPPTPLPLTPLPPTHSDYPVPALALALAHLPALAHSHLPLSCCLSCVLCPAYPSCVL